MCPVLESLKMLCFRWLFHYLINDPNLERKVYEDTKNQEEEILLATTYSKRIHLMPCRKLVEIIYNTNMEFECRREFGDIQIKKQVYFNKKLENLQYLQSINYENCEIINIDHHKHIITITMNYYPWTLTDIFKQNKTLANLLAIEKIPKLL